LLKAVLLYLWLTHEMAPSSAPTLSFWLKAVVRVRRRMVRRFMGLECLLIEFSRFTKE
jgi:hypothetical protein